MLFCLSLCILFISLSHSVLLQCLMFSVVLVLGLLQRLKSRADFIAARIGRNDSGGTSDILRLGKSIWRISGGHTQRQL